MKIYIGTDHRTSEYESGIINELKKSIDVEIILSEKPHYDGDDYPDFALDVLNKMDKDSDLAVLICGTGIGMSIVANKVKGIRAARVVSEREAILAREHNGANVIALGTTTIEEMSHLILTFINAKPLVDERHIRRVSKIMNYENGTYNEL